MENTINFGIDLGTTNSAIAKFVNGEVIVFKNPQDFGRETLPSVVSYRKGKIIVGSKAQEFLEKDPKSVAGIFKRKMGTSERFQIESTGETKTPVELSAQVLKELKTFVIEGEIPESVVITIPASFDMIQSNATKEAGYLAGFKQVVLLQEPIAASLAYANTKKTKEVSDVRWLVYDLGGGTFDVALIRIKDGEMKVIDHEGNNFLGGADFDQLIVDKIVIPALSEAHVFHNLEQQMKSASGKYNGKYLGLVSRTEEAKIRLSASPSAEITVDGMDDEAGNQVDMEITITRQEFNALIEPYIDETVNMISQMLVRNKMAAKDLEFVLMVGGSTYIPYIRQRMEEMLSIRVNCEIDPTTAVAIGAAYYASTKLKETGLSYLYETRDQAKLSIKTSYHKVSREKEELFAAQVTGSAEGLFYKIVRLDGGFDSGLKPLEERIKEDLPLVENTFNYFTFNVYNNQNNHVESGVELIGINSGYGISGQTLPEDICLETDDLDNPGSTKLVMVFERNSILPAKKILTFPINKPIVQGNGDDRIWINVYEGPQASLPEANKPIGIIEINGNQVSRNIAKGSDIEISISMTESRDLKVSVWLSMSEQEFGHVFSPKERETNIELLKEQVVDLSVKLELEMDEASDGEDFETAGALFRLQKEIDEVAAESNFLAADDVTDKRYQLEDKKRKIAQEIDLATKDKRLQKIRKRYLDAKEECLKLLQETGNETERSLVNEIIAQEEIFLSSNNPVKIQEKADELHNALHEMRWRTPEFLIGIFALLRKEIFRMSDQFKALNLIESGVLSIETENWFQLREVNYGLIDLFPRGDKDDMRMRIGF